MAQDLPVLVSHWKYQTGSVVIPTTGAFNAIPADPERLAIGFAHFGTSNVNAYPQAGGDLFFWIWLRGNVDRWLYWQKHGSMVNQAWSFNSDLGAPDVITFATISRTDIGS